MNPTPRLRWIERLLYWDGRTNTAKTEKVLQQWYAYDIEYPMTKGEWRDVPLEKEA